MLKTMQPEAQERWGEVGQAIEGRVGELFASQADFLRASEEVDPKGEGISAPTLKRWIKGGRIGRGDKQWVLCDTLRWTRNSIELIHSGRPPITLESDPGGHGGSKGWPVEWENEVIELRDEVRSLSEKIDGLAKAFGGRPGDAER